MTYKELQAFTDKAAEMCKAHKRCTECPVDCDCCYICNLIGAEITEANYNAVMAWGPPADEIDWGRVPVDTPVLVWNTGKAKEKRYFARKSEMLFGVYGNGATSWSSGSCIDYWDYCELARPEDAEKYRK